ncbi:hypothetical protein GCM10023187_18880 [Nibrella viscosa]|uniref:DUF5683 domain-containing protein n=1 Tax=Nibrella viscosa TaxID=1084524 RepID=A0ABP8KA95_9BACT
MKAVATYLIGLIGLLAVLAPARCLGQKAPIANVRVEWDATRAKIMYDLADNVPADSIYIQVESRSKGLLAARTVSGDIGRGVMPGQNKTVYWDYPLDRVVIGDKDQLRAEVFVKSPATGGGPANALASLLVPGLGNVLVQPNRQIGLRPLITAGYGGLLAYGLIQRSRANRQYSLYESQLTAEDAEPFYQESARLRHHYLITTRAAAAVLVADVVYTFFRGRSNLKQQVPKRVVFHYLDETPIVGVQFTF